MLAPMRLLPAALLLLTLSGLAPADEDHTRAREAVRRGEILSLAVLLERVRLAPGERLLEAELERDDGRWIYELELISADGEVREIELDAATGALLPDDDEDDED
jgi:uncharacterized membrane protein YkoI